MNVDLSAPKRDWESRSYLFIAVLLSGIAGFIEIQNIRSLDDRRTINQRLERAEAKQLQISQDVGYMRAVVEEAVARDAARTKAKEAGKR